MTMSYRIVYLPDTVADQELIKTYLQQFYPNTIKKYFNLLKSKTTRLKIFPYSCPKYDDDPDYRILTVADYLVFYMANEEKKIVEIHRIFHGSQNISDLIPNK